jgi:hypothetical protein
MNTKVNNSEKIAELETRLTEIQAELAAMKQPESAWEKLEFPLVAEKSRILSGK